MKKTLKKLSKNKQNIKNHKNLRWIAKHLHIPNLWNFNRKTIAKGVAIGLFCAFIPIPFQMLLAAPMAIIFRGNILISIALVWITNPITIPPIFYACYKLGAWILNIELVDDFELSVNYIINILYIIWQPLLLGSIIVAIISSFIGYYAVNIYYLVIINKRKMKYRKL